LGHPEKGVVGNSLAAGPLIANYQNDKSKIASRQFMGNFEFGNMTAEEY
jgi:hypothetical protein